MRNLKRFEKEVSYLENNLRSLDFSLQRNAPNVFQIVEKMKENVTKLNELLESETDEIENRYFNYQ